MEPTPALRTIASRILPIASCLLLQRACAAPIHSSALLHAPHERRRMHVVPWKRHSRPSGRSRALTRSGRRLPVAPAAATRPRLLQQRGRRHKGGAAARCAALGAPARGLPAPALLPHGLPVLRRFRAPSVHAWQPAQAWLPSACAGAGRRCRSTLQRHGM